MSGLKSKLLLLLVEMNDMLTSWQPLRVLLKLDTLQKIPWMDVNVFYDRKCTAFLGDIIGGHRPDNDGTSICKALLRAFALTTILLAT